ncbi:regulatory protein GemA [Mesorhizobium sp. 2RAF21]|uniref:regulatory protein GemA n=1 Tax=Mesorhizobium sp. 2RAF21 TaxID=3232995 RepID=UPI003F94DD84
MSATAAIHVAKKQLGLDDDTIRDVYERVTGKRSLRDMSAAEQNNVVQELRRGGFKPASMGSRKRLEGKYAAKLQALWIAAWNLGIVKSNDDRALVAFVERQTGLSHVRFLHDAGDAVKAIEGLKGWMTREAGVDWSDTIFTATWMKLLGAKIAVAQWNILIAKGAEAPSFHTFRAFVATVAKPVDQMRDGDWMPVMNTLGDRVRKAVGK